MLGKVDVRVKILNTGGLLMERRLTPIAYRYEWRYARNPGSNPSATGILATKFEHTAGTSWSKSITTPTG